MSDYSSIKKPINENIKRKCWEYLKTHNLANRGTYDGDKEKQYIGLLGEMETYNLLKGSYPDLDDKKDGFDGGVDIEHLGITIDVKTMGRKHYTKPEYVNNYPKMQLHYDCDMLLFASINRETNYIEFCGWMWKNELNIKGTLYKKGTIRKRGSGTMETLIDNYEIKNSELRDVRELIEL